MHKCFLIHACPIHVDMEFQTSRDPGVVILENDHFDRVYKNLPTQHLVLRKVPICEYCGAIRFSGEGASFCCRQGKVNIVNTPIPDDLCRLFTSQTDRDALYFRNNIRYFNSHFSFTSFGATVDHRVATAAGNYFKTIHMECLCTLLYTSYILI